ncbi:MAG: CheR family methyltransferase [Rhodospirillaceae bacterium]
MRTLDNAADVDKFRSLILARLGLNFDETKFGFLAEVIQTRLQETRLSPSDYLHRLENSGAESELSSLATKLTVPETYFFRNKDQFRALREAAIPKRTLARGDTRIMNVLSAGCASGEEPYSLAMTLMGMMDPSWNWTVRAIDINTNVLKKARRGRYTTWALRETSDEDVRRWFRQEEKDYVLDERVRKSVAFQECNLMADNFDVWEQARYDIIFCRNVLMYFSPEQARKVVAKIAHALTPGGFLFLGHAETLRGLSEEFHLRHTHDAFYYERKQAGETVSAAAFAAFPAYTAPPVPAPSLSEDWIQSIHRASERVQALSTHTDAPPTAVSAPPPLPPLPRKAPDMTPVFAMIHSDRFADALDFLAALPNEVSNDPDVLLVQAMLLAHSGKTKDAETVCERLLAIDEMSASAHHVLALCRESAADIPKAMEHDRIAAYLDPTFAMPHLHMGLMGRRTGNRELARRELAHALQLLKHEDGARLMLFGGGFNRQSMIELCASALKDCGGQP